MSVLDADAVPAELETGAAAPVEAATVSQKVPRPRYKRYARRRRNRKARRKARRERRGKAPVRKGVITVDPPIRNNK
ncbi:hypothetical protein GCM10027048_06350 [Hymenobacter coalescens]